MIEKLFIKSSSQETSMTVKEKLIISSKGIHGHNDCHKWRQVLILPRSVLEEFGLEPGQLKENILIDDDFDIHALPSGSVIQAGSAKIRLTFHCEPCVKIKHLVSTRKITFKRGYLGQCLNEGVIECGDEIKIIDERHESIPYLLADRIKWYLDGIEGKIMVSDLVLNIGLSKSYCRAIPNIIRNRDDIDKSKIIYKKNK
ncbi:MOSC domain-containing protein [Moritella marina ATCC 15381]|uniref:MOSC domain-containing protein n=1 Tax=Moritella marina ATCC 15381 TaxID=1202962 RepID=A0A5J6WQ93_MORMI|nr:MOSC domain-containing protein [Moritella marina]QFI39130.1 MOSC domain-containing protein [Moritella marina ATCC 15381]